MYHFKILVSAIAALPLARGIAFSGPAPTQVAPNVDKAEIGWTPRPTKGPSIAELRRRQENLYPETCGWVNGNWSRPVTCNFGTCALYLNPASSVAMAGCCDDGDTQNCGWAKACVNYDSYTKKSCDSECMRDTFIRKCTNSSMPYCVTWTYPSDGVADYGCASYNSGVDTIYQEAIDLSDLYTTSMTLPTLTGDAVTGWDGVTSASENVYSDSSESFFDVFTPITPTESVETAPTDEVDSGDSTTTTTRRKKKSVSVGAIVGAAIGGLAVLFIIGAALIFFCVKKRKQRQLANNQAIIAAQAPTYQPPMQQQFAPPAPAQSPPPQGYSAGQDQKYDYQTQVQEHGVQSPITSDPPTPTPPYVPPYYAAPNAAPVPAEGVPQHPAREPTPGTYEVDAITAPQARPPPAGVFEMGYGK